MEKTVKDGGGAERHAPDVVLSANHKDQAGRRPGRYRSRKLLRSIFLSLSDKPLKELVAEKLSSEANEQKALDKLSRQNNWDVALSVGVHQQVNPVAQNPQPYGAVSVNYNLASRAINKHLDRAVEAYSEWKKVQEGDVVRNAEVLRPAIGG